MIFKNRQKFNEDDLESVIEACLREEGQAQRALIRLFLSYAKVVCSRYAGNSQEVEEIINDGFLKVFNNLVKYDHSQPFKAWLRTILVNTAIDYYRKGQRFAHPVEIDHLDISDLHEDVLSKISAEEILLLIQKLPPAYRMVFTLYVIDGYTHREIADMLGIKEGTSKSNLQDARRKLQSMLKVTHPHLYMAYVIKTKRIDEN